MPVEPRVRERVEGDHSVYAHGVHVDPKGGLCQNGATTDQRYCKWIVGSSSQAGLSITISVFQNQNHPCAVVMTGDACMWICANDGRKELNGFVAHTLGSFGVLAESRSDMVRTRLLVIVQGGCLHIPPFHGLPFSHSPSLTPVDHQV